jgi:hypothetical protein
LRAVFAKWNGANQRGNPLPRSELDREPCILLAGSGNDS